MGENQSINSSTNYTLDKTHVQPKTASVTKSTHNYTATGTQKASILLTSSSDITTTANCMISNVPLRAVDKRWTDTGRWMGMLSAATSSLSRDFHNSCTHVATTWHTALRHVMLYTHL